MRHFLIFLLIATLALTVNSIAFAEGQNSKKIESFDFLIDGSSSMGGNTKDSLSSVLHRVNDRIPELEYPESGMHTFAPEDMVLDFSLYSHSRFADGIDKLINDFPGAKNTSLGKGFDYYGPIYSDMLRKGAVVVFTDGSYGSGRDSVNEAKIFYLTQPEMCLHFVSFAKDEKSQQVIDEMASISECTVSVLAEDLLNSDEAADDFVRRVFYNSEEGGQDSSTPSSPAAIDFVMLSIPFAFDSDKLDENTIKVANALAERMKENPELTLKIDGYTCNSGPAEYNLELSKRRAATVKNYIVNAGVAPSRITTEGFGLDNPRYDNNTKEGRSLNRRVEFTFFSPEQAQ